MKCVLEISNLKKVAKPNKNNVILYDGSSWYVTSLEDIVKPIYTKLTNYESELAKLNKNYTELANSTAKSLSNMADLIKKLYGGK